MKDVLNDLFEYKLLTEQTAREILKNLAQGVYNNSQVASFLTVYLMRSITVEELQGFREAMLELCVPVDIQEYDPMDLCGTGGDGKDTFNISTLASFIVAGAGQYVAKHGNVGVSSICGSSDLLTHFGYEFTNDVDVLKKSLDRSGICFLHAPLFHPAMKNVAPIRKELGVKTFFNMLGPMVNPSRLQKQLVGVFSLELARLYGYLYQQYGENYAIVHSLDGYDEISLTSGFRMITKNEEKVIYPEDLGFEVLNEEDLAGGNSIEESARLFVDILELNGTKAQEQVGIANAGMALYISGKYDSLDDSRSAARESLKSGNELAAFKNFINGK